MESIIEKYKTLVYGIALARLGNTYDADEVFQDVFLAYFRKTPTFNSPEHEKAWLIRTTLNLCKKTAFHPWKKRMVLFESVEPKGDFTFQLPEENELYQALQALPSKYRMPIYLHYFENYATAEIAELLKIKPGTVRMRLNRGREMLRERLGE